jgi:hypothetical protein
MDDLDEFLAALSAYDDLCRDLGTTAAEVLARARQMADEESANDDG